MIIIFHRVYSIIFCCVRFSFCGNSTNSCRLLAVPTAFSDRRRWRLRISLLLLLLLLQTSLAVSRLHDADLGYVLIVDRRSDRWNAVKATLLRLSVCYCGCCTSACTARASLSRDAGSILLYDIFFLCSRILPL